MDILSVDYTGYITIDKDDLVVFNVDPKTGEQTTIDPKSIDTHTLLAGIKNGDYYVNLEACFSLALDGEQTIDVDL